jgi:GNAT superfamily N-acetyltransferase
MPPVQLKDRSQLSDYFRQDIQLHLYSLGDLDDFYWSKSTCYGIQNDQSVDKVVLLYQGEELPVLLALSDPGRLDKGYIQQLIPRLPPEFYAHLSPGVEEGFLNQFSITDAGGHYKMELQDRSQIMSVNTEHTCLLMEQDREDIQALYQESYPGNSFDPRMLLTGKFYGYRKNGHLLSIGGIHVFSPVYRVAALGNITTHPEYRNQGMGRAVTAKLCLSLLENVDIIGLNVKQDNLPAINLYKSLGFKISSEYGEFSLKNLL